ncbi:MAG: alcohol dehydrogenase, partial [Planctomycetales bacterium]|nr:alcohol dehydrogenase [Planctomycetales bacterium]
YLQVEHVDESWTIDVLWTNPTSLKTKFTNCVVRDGYAYGLSDGILECVRLEDGQKQWKKGRYRQGQLLLVGEYLLITAESGELVLVQADPQGMKELDKLAVIGDVTWNTAALSGDRLLMRNAEEAACVLLPLRTLATENE